MSYLNDNDKLQAEQEQNRLKRKSSSHKDNVQDQKHKKSEIDTQPANELSKSENTQVSQTEPTRNIVPSLNKDDDNDNDKLQAEQEQNRLKRKSSSHKDNVNDHKHKKSEIDTQPASQLSKSENTQVSQTEPTINIVTSLNKDDDIDSNHFVVGPQHGKVVAEHYNQLEERGLKERFNSPIFYLRNFNNWVKSVLIQEYTDKLRNKNYGLALRVLDICCGKGGDLSKWVKARVEHVILADIAEVSVEQCKSRYCDLKQRSSGKVFSAEFIAADCSAVNLREKYKDPSIQLDLVSCQFGFHYSFESLSRARCMFKNISDCLKPNGYFIGTIPNAYEIISRCRKSTNKIIENRIFNIKLLFDPNENGYPLFGGKYDFNLEGVVDCPEFLVNFELLCQLAKEFGLELVYQAPFSKFYEDHCKTYQNLLKKIQCLECYPAGPSKHLVGNEAEYEHAREYLLAKNHTGKTTIGTMSNAEWEVATIYMAFAFQKQKLGK